MEQLRMTDIITNPNWRWYFLAAAIGSLIYGFAAFHIHGAPAPKGFKRSFPKGWQFFHQIWLNFLGAAMGWLAGWVVLNRWLACPSFMCADEPRFSTVVLAIGAYIGMVGLLPYTVLTGVAALKSVLETYFQKLTGTSKP
jgi:hypothetical protein